MLEFIDGDRGAAPMPYADGLDLQRAVHRDVVAGRRPDTVILLEHEPVYTAGCRTSSRDRPTDGSPVVDVDRGGRITWHGPGQLVGYPILRLPDPVDVVAHVRRLEEALLGVLADLGVPGLRVEGRSGVWVETPAGTDKVAAIGARVASGATMHGFALNCSNPIAPFEAIVPCGIDDAGVTTLSRILGRTVTPADAEPLVRARLAAVLEPVTA